MKNKISTSITIIILSFQLNSSFAQLSVGANISTASRWSVPERVGALGYGFDVSVKYRFWKGLTTGASFAYMLFGPEESTSNNYTAKYTSGAGMLEYHWIKNKFQPYAGIMAGIYNYHTVTTIQNLSDPYVKNENYFGFGPVLGANYPVMDRLFINANIKLNIVPIDEGNPIGYTSLGIGMTYNIFK